MANPKTYRRPVKPTPKPCPRCRRKVLAGLDARAAALSVVIDAEALTREGELLMIVAGVKCYATDIHNEIIRRTPAQILTPHPIRHYAVHRVHDCEQPTPAHLVVQAPAKPTVQHYEGLPF